MFPRYHSVKLRKLGVHHTSFTYHCLWLEVKGAPAGASQREDRAVALGAFTPSVDTK